MAETPHITHNQADKQFEARLDGIDAVGFAEYREHNDAIEFHHTVVPPEMGGRGVASALAKAALAWAQETKDWIIPSCSFFTHYIGKHPEYRDRVSANFPFDEMLAAITKQRS